jgi:Fe-S-cluster containining protein
MLKLVSNSIDTIYRSIDKQIKEHEDNHKYKFSCKKGCASCCRLMCIICRGEGVRLADYVVTNLDWVSLVEPLKVAALNYCYDDIDHGNYFDKKIPCVFLKNELCSVYEARPFTCRTHLVVSPPERCSPDHKDGSTQQLNTQNTDKEFWLMDAKIFGKLVLSPLPLMTLWAMHSILKELGEDTKLVSDALDTLPFSNPQDWMETHALRIAEYEFQRNNASYNLP